MNISQVNQLQKTHPQKDPHQTEINPEILQHFQGELVFAENDLNLIKAAGTGDEKHRSHLEDVEKKRENDDQEKRITRSQWQTRSTRSEVQTRNLDEQSRDDIILHDLTPDTARSDIQFKNELTDKAALTAAAKKTLSQDVSQERLQIHKPYLNNPTVQQSTGDAPKMEFAEILKTQQSSTQQKSPIDQSKAGFQELTSGPDASKQVFIPSLQRSDRPAMEFKMAVDQSTAEKSQTLQSISKKESQRGDLALGKGKKDQTFTFQSRERPIVEKSDRFTNDLTAAVKNDTDVDGKTPFETKSVQTTKSGNINSVIDNVRIMLSSGKDSIVIRLMPEHLGKLEIKLKKSGEKLVGEFKVENAEAKELLASEFQQLQQDLENQGIRLESFTILVKGEPRPAPVFKGKKPAGETPSVVSKDGADSEPGETRKDEPALNIII